VLLKAIDDKVLQSKGEMEEAQAKKIEAF